MAHGGTIFLDEIGELPQHIQVKLLRVLQERVIQRLGSEEMMPINVRVMAATNRDLHEEMNTERFRSDLYYRLSVVTLEVPPLRLRREDIASLCERYLAEFRLRMNIQVSSFSDEALSAMEEYSWPGNIRELINVVERSLLLCDGDQITLDDLPRSIAHSLHQSRNSTQPVSPLELLMGSDWQNRAWKDVRNRVIRTCEQAYFVHHLEESNGNVDNTAIRADINPRSLYDVMKRHGLKKEEFRNCSK
jgi:DNA-binding NtrC family response regulator